MKAMTKLLKTNMLQLTPWIASTAGLLLGSLSLGLLGLMIGGFGGFIIGLVIKKSAT